MKNSVLYLIFVLILLMGCFSTVSSEDIVVDPLSQIGDLDAYIQNWEENYKKELEEEGITPEEASQYGYRPFPLEDLMPPPAVSTIGRLTANSLPSSFDLRDYGRVGSVKNQGSYGTCWAFSVINSIESSVLTKQLATSTDLAERHLAYFTYNRNNDPLGNVSGDLVTPVGSTYYSAGFNNVFTPFILSSWTGPVLETKAPYNESSWSNLDSSLQYGSDAFHVKNVYRFSMDYDRDGVKSAIQTYGAGAISYLTYSYYYQSGTYNGKNYTSYYYPYATSATNHAVSVIGWDDNFPKENFSNTPSGDGAWLIKQSWGDDWGTDGYFWLSYYDNSLADDVYFYEAEAVGNHKRIYQYDGSAAYYYVWNDRMANIFTAKYDETISSVSFGTADSIIDYTVKVYTGCTAGNPESGTLAVTVSGTTENEYIKTIDLPKDVSVNKGALFSVVVDLGGEYDGHYLVDSTEDYSWVQFTSYGCPGQSYYYSGGNWYDMNDSCGSDAVIARIKAYSVGTSVSGVQATVSGQNAALSWTALPGATSYEIFRSSSSDSGFTKVGTATGTSFTATGLNYGSTWYYKVRAVLQSSGKYSDYSNTVQATIPTPSISGLKATISETTATLTWNALAGRKQYEIWRSTSATSGFTKIGTCYGTTVNFTGLTAGTTYYYKVRALMTDGSYSNYSAVATAAIPAAVSGLKATVNGTGVTLTWNAFTNRKLYEIWRSTSATSGFAKLGTCYGTTVTFTGLTAGTTYYYKVRAQMSDGSYSNYSAVATTAIPAAVSGLNATVNGTGVTLTWNAFTNRKLYEIWRSTSATSGFAKLGTCYGTTVNFTGLTAGTTYYYKVRAQMSDGSYSNYSAVATAAIPAAVSGLKATVNGTGVTLTWNAFTNRKLYEIWRSTSATSGFAKLGTCYGTTVTFTGLTAGTTYYYKVRAQMSDGSYSNYSAVATAAIPNAVSGLKATVSGTSVTLTWNAFTNRKLYEIWRSTSATSGFAKLGTCYGTTVTFSGLTAGTTYYYKVRALMTDGSYSNYSAVATAAISNTAVSGLNATVNGTGVTLTWNAFTNRKLYEIWRSTSATSGFAKLGTCYGTTVTFTGLTAGTTYYYKVRAQMSDGSYSNYSAVVTAAIPNAVSGLNATVNGTSVTLSWNAYTNRKQYEIWRSTSATSGFAKLGTCYGTTVTFSGLTAGTTYYYKVRALMTDGSYSNYSAVVTAAIPNANTVLTVNSNTSDTPLETTFFWLGNDFLNDPNRPAMPATGFPTGHFTALPSVSASTITPTGVTLRVPSLNINAEVAALGLDKQSMNYDISLLNDKLGYLEGTALPGQGFSILVGHNHLNTMETGPFAYLYQMEANDRLFITDADDEMTVYSVYANLLIDANDYQSIAENVRENALILITCEDETTEGNYLHRRVIFAEQLG